MITLSNGHQFEFCAASGALGFDGRGWWFEQPWRWLGLLRPEEFTVITKTLTFSPRAGNLKMWCPWRCIRPSIKRGWVNAVGLTNGGITPWMIYADLKYKTIASIAPNDVNETDLMIKMLNDRRDLVGVELNVSCPNVDHAENTVQIAEAAVKQSRHPVIVKLSVDQPWLELVNALDGKVEAFDLINAVAWKTVMGDRRSPLSRYGLTGGVSGRPIKNLARQVLSEWAAMKFKTPVISGGGIDSYDEVKKRFRMGAAAVSFGTVFISRPWLPNQIVRRIKRETQASHRSG